jgi:hypothetical protein
LALSGDVRWLTNCVRILTRLLSVMHETHGDQLSEHLLWGWLLTQSLYHTIHCICYIPLPFVVSIIINDIDVPLPDDEKKGATASATIPSTSVVAAATPSSTPTPSSAAPTSGSVAIAINDAPPVVAAAATTTPPSIVARASASAPTSAAISTPTVSQAPMAARLVWALCELLFRPYFTVAPPDVDG